MAPVSFAGNSLLHLATWALAALPAAAVTGRGRMVEDLLEGEPPQHLQGGRVAGPAPLLEINESAREPPRRPHAAVSFGSHGNLQQLSGVGRREAAAGKRREDGGISLYHWSPHWQCFAKNENGCAEKAKEQITTDLMGYDVDFAFIIEMGSYDPPIGYAVQFGNCDSDMVAIIYKTDGWTPGKERPGCMDPNNRGFLVNSFTSSDSGIGDIVVSGAHFPHPHGTGDPRMKIIGEMIEEATASTKKIIFMADTNLEDPSEDIAQAISIPDASIFSDVVPTCCWQHGQMGGARFDRIIASFGSSLDDFEVLHTDPVPDWAGDEMHAGLKATLRL